MNILTADVDMLDDIKNIWHLCFGDAEPYVDLFLNHHHVAEYGLVLCEERRPVAMLFMLPLEVVGKDKNFNARYVYAVATHPDYRGKGYSSILLEEAHNRMRAQGVDLSILVPATPSLFDFYSKRGYVNQFFLSVKTFAPVINYSMPEVEFNKITPKTTEHSRKSNFTDVDATDELGNFYKIARVMKDMRNDYFNDCALISKWDIDHILYCLTEADFVKTEVLCFSEPTSGYAIITPNKEHLIIKELVCKNEPLVINSIARRYNPKLITLNTKCHKDSDTVPFGMAYWFCDRPATQGEFLPYLSMVLD